MGLGRVEPQNLHEAFCMTVLGLKLSRRANAVSCAARPRYAPHVGPPLAVAGGGRDPHRSHHQRRAHPAVGWRGRCSSLYDRHFPADWMRRMGEPDVWQHIYNVDPGELWETHNALKNLLMAFVRRRVSRQCRRRGESDEAVEAARNVLDPNILTIGFGRRFATYKRADADPHRPRPARGHAQRLRSGRSSSSSPARPTRPTSRASNSSSRSPTCATIPRFAGRIVFVEDYDINVCRHLIQGVDVWLNNPRRPLEASGTSGQKAVLNGGLNLSVLDGWWAEAYDGTNGFAIGKGTSHVRTKITDAATRNRSTDVLEQEIIPMFYERDVDGLPRTVDQEDDELDRFAGLAVQRPSDGHGLRAALLRAGRRWLELRDEHPLRGGANPWPPRAT